MARSRISRWLTGAVMLAMMDVALVAVVDLAADRAGAGAIFPRLARNCSAALAAPAEFLRPACSAAAPWWPGPLFFRAVRNGRARAAPLNFARAARQSKCEPRRHSIMVMGDSMADWLAYGLEDAFSDAPEIGIVRKIETQFGPAALRRTERSRLVACRARHSRQGEGRLRRHDARRQRPPAVP